MQIVPAIAVEGLCAREICGLFVPAPEPRELLPWTFEFLAAVLVPFDLRRRAQNACALRPCSERLCAHEGTDVQANPVIDIRLPAYYLLVEWLPPHEKIVWWLTNENVRELQFQFLC